MRATRRFTLLALGLAVPLAAGCNPEPAESRTEAEPARMAAETAAPADALALADPQIAHVAVIANTVDAEMGRLALERASSPEVRAFAQTMVTDHTAVNEQAAALAGRLGVTPEDNPVSRSLQDGAAEARSRLEGLSGEAFDRAYMEREVAYHQAVLDALDQTLIPGATNEELRGLLQQVRPAIAAHLDHARSLLASLGTTEP